MKGKRILATALFGIFLLMAGCTPGATDAVSSTGGMWGNTGSKPVTSRPEQTYDLEEGWIIYDQEVGVAKTGALDFSYLNDAPAGKHGHVVVKDGHFYFEDGTRVRFFGVNLAFAAAYPDKPLAERIAAELASQGVNFVRLHGVDCSYAGIVDYTGTGLPKINEKNLDKLDYLVYCLKEKGIYIHMDTNAGRILKEAEGFSQQEVAYAAGGTMRAARFIDERIVEIETNFIREYVGHKNPYTGMTYAEDPVIAVIQYANESSITWFNGYNENNVFSKQFQVRFNEWLVEKYKTRAALQKAWTNSEGQCALKAEEDPTKGTVRCSVIGGWAEAKVDWKTPYNSVQCAPRFADFAAFLIEIQSKVFTEMYDMLRDMGYKSAINMSNQPEAAIDNKINALGDIMEKNAYWGHPVGDYKLPATLAVKEMTAMHPKVQDSMVSTFARADVADKPFVVTEWNATSGITFRADAIFQVIAYASLQDWDGFCLFTYTFEGDEMFFDMTESFDSFFNSNIDPAMWAQFGMASAAYRQGMIRTAENTIEYVLTEDDVLGSTGNFYFAPRFSVYVSQFSIRFIDDQYDGSADLVISSGNTASGDYTKAKNLLLHSDNPFSDAYQQNKGRESWLNSHKQPGMTEKTVETFSALVGKNRILVTSPVENGFMGGAEPYMLMNEAMNHFGLLDEGEGWSEDRVVSDTGEIILNYEKQTFNLNTDRLVVAAGQIARATDLVETDNDLACVAIFSRTDKSIAKSDKLLVYAMGRCQNYNTKWDGNELISFGVAPLTYEDIRGTLKLTSEYGTCTVWKLNYKGERVGEAAVKKTDDGFEVTLGGCCNYEVEFK
ncbi:MAG: beta-galactosidase [Oscillospiraceae bacterium]|nr:beta-galactosidase [Oscillospiraceae bacterium]